MPLPSSIADLSTSAASNSPAGSDSIGTSLDDYLRAIQAIIKQQFSTGTQLASGSTITPQADGNFINVTGISAITAIASTNSWNGRIVVLKFADSLTITHSANLVLPNASNITTAANEVFSFIQESAGVWRCIAAPTSASRALAASNFTTAQGLQFPATQNPSSDPNTLDDYEEGTWTPAITFTTPGNLSVTYASQLGRYTKIGRVVHISFAIVASTFTHTTAVGELVFTGLPFTAANQSDSGGGALILFTGITKAGYSQYAIRTYPGLNQAYIIASGSSVTAAYVSAADCPTGTTKEFYGEFTYQI